MYRTNFFEYCDTERIEKDSIDNNVLCMQNGRKVSLIGKKKDILNVIIISFVKLILKKYILLDIL